MKFNTNKIHTKITIISIIILITMSYSFFQPQHTYETNYTYRTTNSVYQHNVNITVSIKGQQFTSNIIVRESGINNSKKYYKINSSGKIFKENTHQYYLVFDCIDVYTGTTEANMVLYKKNNSSSTIINKVNDIRVLYFSENYIVIALFFYNGQIITLHKC